MSNEREAFEALVQYRQFLGRHKDGTYELEWVEGRWQGWKLRAEWQRSQSAPAGYVMPERMKESIHTNLEWVDGWNECLKEIARLNAAAPKAEPQPVSDDVAKALKTAANRMQRLALEVDGDWRGYAAEWAEEALAEYRAAMGSKGDE